MNTTAPGFADGSLQAILLGRPRLMRGSVVLLELNRIDAALLALLVLDGSTDRARAAAWLWPDVDPRRANLSLRQRIFRLKRASGADVVAGQRQLTLAAGVKHDLGALSITPPPGSAAAVDWPRGALLGSFDYADSPGLAEWVFAARERWRVVRRDSLAAAAAQLEADGRIAAALVSAERLLEEEPAAEHAHRRIMRLHYLRADRAAALDAFERCRHLLNESLGVLPSDETLALLQLIERGDPPPSQPPVAPPPLALLRPPRLIGRESAWQHLDEALAAQRPLLLVGEPGIGKSRLLADYVQAHRPGVLVDARPGDRSVPYALLSRLLQALHASCGLPDDRALRDELAWLVPALGCSPAAPLQPARLHAAVRRTVAHAAAGGLRVLALDDLQFADEASLEAVLSACQHPGAPLWLLAVRAGERPAVLQHWLAERDVQAGGECRLQPLPAPALHALLQSLAVPGLAADDWTQPLLRHTGGNPMFVLQTVLASLGPAGELRGTADLPLPLPVGALIERRLDQLGPAPRRLAQLLALADVDFSIALAAQVLGCHALDLAGPWRELEQAQVVAGDGFAHDLVREACLRTVPEPIARELLAQIGACAEAHALPAARTAEHWRRAGRWREAAVAFRLAAAGALTAGRRREEAQLLQAAADAFARAGHEAERFDALCERIGALVQCAGGDELRETLQALQALPADEVQAAQRALALAEAQIVFGEFDAVAAAMPAAIARLAGDADAALLGARRLAVALLNLGRPADAAALLAGGLPRLAQLRSARPRYEFLGELGTVLERCNRRREGFEHLQHGIRLALQDEDVGTAATMYANLGVNRVFWGDADAAIEATERGLRLRQQHDGLAGLASGIDMTLGAMCRDVGRYAEAIERLERSHAAFEADANRLWTANAGNHLALLWLQLGQWARATRLLQDDGDDGLPPFISGRRVALRALAQHAQGRPALAGLDAALATLAAGDRADVRLAIQLERSRHLEAAAALALCEAVAAEARAAELMGHTIGAQALAIDALLRAGDAQQAALRAEALCADGTLLAPTGFYRPELGLLIARGLQAGGRSAQAAQVRAQALDWVQRAVHELPAPFHDSFLRRNAVNRALAG
ncbi:AAA family ATPase [Aquincola sp. S2]|uniref:AAA family ATPase n=1 Tax=Pseudaquabacterium terrae TaxID=2732868 RepID=A0ABX2EUN2_9BURK|nr:AAA family ATPase [Aquabacterium terrae]NRF72425.1 AAA family ATPase [Aquabacterium terrae]